MKIVNRRTFIAKRGHVDEAVALLKGEEGDIVSRLLQSLWPLGCRRPEVEIDSVAAMEHGWAEWFATP